MLVPYTLLSCHAARAWKIHDVGAALTNQQIADRLLSFSALLDLAEASPYAARAYRRAAEVVRAIPLPVAELVRTGRVRELRGIGPGIERKLRELVETGDIAELRELESELRPELIGLGRLLGLSSRRVLEIARALDIDTAEAFRVAVADGRLQSVPGVGPSTEAKIRAGLEAAPRPRQGLTLNRSRLLTQAIADALDGHVAGDPRRFCELSFDLAVVCAAEAPRPVLDAFEQLPLIVAVDRTDRPSSCRRDRGGRSGDPRRGGAALASAPSSSARPGPRAMSSRSDRCRRGPPRRLCTTLSVVPWRPPELREHPAPPIPASLVEISDIRGDLHCHTVWSDGKATVEEMGSAARDRGYAYLAICDHTANVRVVPGLTAEQVRRQGEEIAEANERLAPFRLLRGIECDILPDGSLDLDDATLGRARLGPDQPACRSASRTG